MDPKRRPIRADRVRTLPASFSYIDRDLLHRGLLEALSKEEILLYFFLILVSGPEGTSFWSHARIAKLLKLTVDEVIEALRGLIRRDLVAFRYPTFQVLSLPEAPRRREGSP
jgi:Helix-turn-helix domain